MVLHLISRKYITFIFFLFYLVYALDVEKKELIQNNCKDLVNNAYQNNANSGAECSSVKYKTEDTDSIKLKEIPPEQDKIYFFTHCLNRDITTDFNNIEEEHFIYKRGDQVTYLSILNKINDSWSGIYIPPYTKVIAYEHMNFDGRQIEFQTAETPILIKCLVQHNFDNMISSFRIIDLRNNALNK
jgi:hypothetical protein